MNYFSKKNINQLLVGLLTVTMITACGKDDDDNMLWLGLLGLNETGSPAAVTTEAPGGETDPTEETTVGGGEEETAGGNEETVGGDKEDGFDIILPSDDVKVDPKPKGDFTGITFTGETTETAGFISVIFNGGGSSASEVAAALLKILNGNKEIDKATVVSSQQAAGASDTQLLNLQLSTHEGMTPTELSNLILLLFGTNKENGSVTGLPTSKGQKADTKFRLVVQILFDGKDKVLLGVGTSTEDNYKDAEPVLTGILDGTNVGPGDSKKTVFTNTFISVGPPKADFLFVVDNSGSMGSEQKAVTSVASKFFDRIEKTNSDFSIGVITTDSDEPRKPGFSNVKKDVITAINAGTRGHWQESGLYFSEKALADGGGVKGSGHPRAESSLSIIILSDEGDNYTYWSKGKNIDDKYNIFTDKGYRVYSIIGLDTTGKPGQCKGENGTSARARNTTHMSYYNVAEATGGASSSICSNDFSAFLDIIATQGVGSASAYQLTKTPISSSIAVSIDGTKIEKSATNGFLYDSVSNSLVFYGTAVPKVGVNIKVAYNTYDSNQAAAGSGLMASILHSGSKTTVMIRLLAIFAVIGMSLIGLIGFVRKRLGRD